jgi:hypothetical protein
VNSSITYVVTDAEFDGALPGRNSMLAFASVSLSGDGCVISEFEATLLPLDGAVRDPETTAFWDRNPEAYRAATLDPQAPAEVMARFAAWVRTLPGEPAFAAHPVALDGPWIDHYLQRFTGDRVLEGPWRPNRLFKGMPFCIMAFAAGRLRRPFDQCDVQAYPAAWLGRQPHTHRAIDDARGYAHLLAHCLGSGR